MKTTLMLLCALAAPLLRGDNNEAMIESVPPPVSVAVGADRPDTGSVRLWKVSLAAVTVANIVDIHSSWGKRELNNALATEKGTFGLQSAAFKLAIQGGMVGVQYFAFRGRPNRYLNRFMTIMNFSAASVTTGTAIRNYGIPRPPR
jgi:hypothetical protein